MTFISDNMLDAALNYMVTHGDRMDICSQEPANVTEATSTYSLGNKTGVSAGAPENGDSSGRKSTIEAVAGGTVTDEDLATHWGFSKMTATAELLVANSIASPQNVYTANPWSMGAVAVTMPDPA